MPSTGRAARPFEIVSAAPDGSESRWLARAVIDASGTWSRPNPAGASGVPALGERAAAARISYGIPDVVGEMRGRFAGRRVMVIGSGHSAMDSILGLTRLRRTNRRRRSSGRCVRPRPNERLAAWRTTSWQVVARSVSVPRPRVDGAVVQLIAPFRAGDFQSPQRRRCCTGDTGRGHKTIAVDEVIVATGFRPDFSVVRTPSRSPSLARIVAALGPLIDPNEHSCGTVPPARRGTN